MNPPPDGRQSSFHRIDLGFCLASADGDFAHLFEGEFITARRYRVFTGKDVDTIFFVQLFQPGGDVDAVAVDRENQPVLCADGADHDIAGVFTAASLQRRAFAEGAAVDRFLNPDRCFDGIESVILVYGPAAPLAWTFSSSMARMTSLTVSQVFSRCLFRTDASLGPSRSERASRISSCSAMAWSHRS